MSIGEEELGAFLEEYVSAHSISTVRKDPRVFASELFRIFSPLALPGIEKYAEGGVKEKTLYALWNVILDDTIEYTELGEEAVLDSFQALVRFKYGGKFTGKTEAGRIMHDLHHQLRALPHGSNGTTAEEVLFMDLTRILNGFDYERIIRGKESLGSMEEYMEFGAVTIDIRVLLDIDILLYPSRLPPSTIRELRKSYKLFSLAFRLVSDLASFEREYFIENSHNAVVLHGIENGLLPPDILRAERAYKEQLLEDHISPLMDEIDRRAKTYLSRSREVLEEIPGLDLDDVSAAFTSMIREYPGHGDFIPRFSSE